MSSKQQEISLLFEKRFLTLEPCKIWSKIVKYFNVEVLNDFPPCFTGFGALSTKMSSKQQEISLLFEKNNMEENR